MYDLRIDSDTFWALCPVQFDALLDRHDLAKQESEFLPAQLIAATINYSMCRPTKPVDARDFMLHYKAANPKLNKPTSKPRMTPKRKAKLYNFIRAWAGVAR